MCKRVKKYFSSESMQMNETTISRNKNANCLENKKDQLATAIMEQDLCISLLLEIWNW